ncbi:Gfo/Idh/MocA family protein [Devosia sp. SL43]|uniref:Gfo/Idh/MocA family protein n=1 Tax=Devosia sp. SL43 TaxID=2806348 RepID=UPI001F207D90|nr:Gfo/Idh/MocA family oxidoreductase [Devosia sp. SL43]UJW85376.1 Gfo/Idh/MocA family oxidoreductase [Devosia sp. SL43]
MAGTTDIRWGIIGPGWIASLFAEDLARTPGSKCVAVASRDLGRAQAFAATHGIDKAYGDYAAIAADPNVDIVYIATPHSHHHQHARLMLEGNKPLVVEKPFAMNAEQAKDIIDLANQRGLFVMDAMWTLCNPLFRTLAARVQAGDIGTPRAFAGSIGPMGGPKDSRVSDPELGGSFTLECMVYPMNILAGLAPNLLKDVNITASGRLTERGVDSASAIHISNADGHAVMSGGFVPGAEGADISTFRLIGDEGWLSVTDNLFNPGRALFSSRGREVEVLVDTASEHRYRWEIEEAARCLRDGLKQSSLVPHDLTIDVMHLLDRSLVQTRGHILT